MAAGEKGLFGQTMDYKMTGLETSDHVGYF